MAYILNDYSIDSQFEDIEILLDSLLNYTIPLLVLMRDHNIELLKSYDNFDLRIMSDMTIGELLHMRHIPEISKFRSLLNNMLSDDPYWQDDDINHDCKMEAVKKKTGLISIEHERYLEEAIEFSIKDKVYTVYNNYNKLQLLERLREDKVINTGRYLEKKFKLIESFCRVENKDYFEEFIKNNDIKEDEIKKLIKEINDFIFRYENGEPLGRLSDNLETNLHEFRTSLSDSKEFRILYCLKDSKFIFLNCFIKKQQKTPENEKKKGRRLRDLVLGE